MLPTAAAAAAAPQPAAANPFYNHLAAATPINHTALTQLHVPTSLPAGLQQTTTAFQQQQAAAAAAVQPIQQVQTASIQPSPAGSTATAAAQAGWWPYM